MYADPSGHIAALVAIGIFLYCFTPVGSAVTQAAVSTVSYAGMAVASIWDEDIRADMNAIGWNPFNTNESAVLGSNKVSFYKGMPVFRTNGGRSGTFYSLLLFAGYAQTFDIYLLRKLIFNGIMYIMLC